MDWLMHPDGIGQKLLVMVLAVVLFALVMGAILLVVDRPRVPRWLPPLGYLGPAVLLIGLGLLVPGAITVAQSFMDAGATSPVGLANYVRIFTEGGFIQVLINTMMWVILVPTVSTVLGLVYAVLVDRTRFERLAKTLIFLPMAISMVGASVIWKFMYEYKPATAPQIGLFNQLLVLLGQKPQLFLLNQPWNNLFLILVMIWIQAGFAMTVLSAAIKAIPDDIIEAARVDGVTGWKLFRNITVPSVRPALVVVLTTIAMATLKAFDIVRTMTGGNFNTSVIANEFYVQSFANSDVGMGSALSVILFVLILPIIVYNVRQMRISEGER